VTVTGEIKEYKGELEIIPNKMEDVIVVKAEQPILKSTPADQKVIQTTVNPPEEQPPQIVDLEKVTRDQIGETVIVQGVLKKVNIFDTVIIGEFRGSDLKFFGFVNSLPALKEMDFVTVTGEIKEYKGELEIVPSKAGDVLVVSGEN